MTPLEVMAIARKENDEFRKKWKELYETNKRLAEEQERAFKEFIVKGQRYFKYPLTKDECFKKED